MAALASIPFLGRYIADGQHGINAAFAGLSAGDKAIEALEPNADLLGLKGKSKFVSGTADERLQTAVKTMSALIPKINEMATHIDTLRREVAAIDPARYPTKVRDVVVREKNRPSQRSHRKCRKSLCQRPATPRQFTEAFGG